MHVVVTPRLPGILGDLRMRAKGMIGLSKTLWYIDRPARMYSSYQDREVPSLD